MPKIDFTNMFKYITDSKTIDDLIVQYNLILDSNEFSNTQMLFEISEFISKLHLRVIGIECKEIQEIYNNNLNDIMILKRKLLTMLQFRNDQFINPGANNNEYRKEKYR